MSEGPVREDPSGRPGTGEPRRKGASWFLMPGRVALLSLALYGVLLWFLRPVNPFEWDEMLAQRAVLHYDVAKHAPQPPGAPGLIGPAKAVNLLAHDPLVALQVVAILMALAAVAATWLLARRLNGSPAMATAAAAIVATSPAFLFMANVGTSDVPGAAGAVVAALALVAAAGNLDLIWVAAMACGVAVGIRPQNLYVYLPALAWVVVLGFKARRWRGLAGGAATGVAVTAAFWVPAILVTGARRWWSASTWLMHYFATVERPYHLPHAKLTDILDFWFLKAHVDWQFAVPLWLLAIVGVIVHVRTGRTKAVAIAGSGLALYLATAFFTLNETVSLRYSIPTLPFVAILAAGGLAAGSRTVRRVVGTAVALWCIAAVAWASPALRERLKPSPVWAGLAWVGEHFDPATTRVIYDGVARPQVQYVLGSKGFRTVERNRATFLDVAPQLGQETLFITPLPVPGAEVLFEARHATDRVLKLAWRRYGSCAVCRLRSTAGPVFSPGWQVVKTGWQLFGTGSVSLPFGSKPALVKLCAGGDAITYQLLDATVQRLRPAECAMVPLRAGPSEALQVSAPDHSATVIPPIEFLPVSASDTKETRSSAFMVPLVAHVPGLNSAFWQTDLVLINPQKQPLPVSALLLPTGGDNATAMSASTTLAPGQVLSVPDVLSLPPFRGKAKVGAMIVFAGGRGECAGEGCGFAALARTYNVSAPGGGWRTSEWLEGVPPGSAERFGDTVTFSHVSNDTAVGASVGIASWSPVPVRVRVRVVDKTGRTVEARELDLRKFGHVHEPLAGAVSDGRVEVEIVAPRAGALIVPYLSMVERATGLPTQLLPDHLPSRTTPHPLPLPEAVPAKQG